MKELKVNIPYGRDELQFSSTGSRINSILYSSAHEFVPEKSEDELVANAINQSINSLPLHEIAVSRKHAVIITSDHTRPVPSRKIMPWILKSLRRGNPEIKISILVATGLHRPTTREELIYKLGEKIVQDEEIIIHYADNQHDMVDFGLLPSGNRLWLNRHAAECDLLVAESFIEPHFFAGFSGGGKSVLPGVAGAETIKVNHCAEFIAAAGSRTGRLHGNPIRMDIDAAAQRAGLEYIVNVVIDSHKNIVAAFAGHYISAHRTGVNFLKSLCRVEGEKTDIVVVGNGGYPLDQNIYQAVKGMTAAEELCNEGGVIIMAASCCDGHGGEALYQALKNADDPAGLLDEILAVPADRTAHDQWQVQILARILTKFTVIMVTEQKSRKFVEDMKMQYAASLDEALKLADRFVGQDKKINVIPDGVAVVAKARSKK
ncbi:nickel-dependent lactate racemase [Lentisphaerota bacterium ZTH]|nr:nickel-dependent lactate racemase [Lentisphaerota bacterium]WET07227.1 nickel-dependent lactate racemase [Lentisphaerota bacterium ZTH]